MLVPYQATFASFGCLPGMPMRICGTYSLSNLKLQVTGLSWDGGGALELAGSLIDSM